jgi:hypothetical protein
MRYHNPTEEENGTVAHLSNPVKAGRGFGLDFSDRLGY